VDDPRIRSYREAARALQAAGAASSPPRAGRFDVAIPAEGDDSLAAPLNAASKIFVRGESCE
jgi:hypothetical protein